VSPPPIPTKIRFDTFELDPTSGELRKSGILLKLQPQPFRVLLLLIERAGQVVSREEIQRRLWTESTFVDFEHGINFSINQIRRALADNAEKPRYVETLPKRGYRFICVVERPSLLEQSATSQADRDARYQSTKEVQASPRRLGTEDLESSLGPARRGKSPLDLAVSVGAP
jgi:DNA-binding winged helix-turn-helix (wHTH) protein